MTGTLKEKSRLPALAVAGALLGVVCGTVLSQVKQASNAPDAAENKPGKLWLVNSDEELAQFIRDARRLIDQKEYQRAIEILQAIVNRNEGGFTSTSQPAIYTGLRTLAQDMLATMPPEGIALYRQLYDSQARILYEDALAGDEAKLNRLVSMYPNSSFGPKGLELLGSSCFDHGRFAQAVTVWGQLLKVTQEPKDRPLVLAKLAIANHLGGEDAAAKAMLGQLQEQYPQDTANVAGEEQNLASFTAGVLKLPVSTTHPIVTTGPSRREWAGLGSVPNGAVLMDRCDLMLMAQWVYTESDSSQKLRVPGDLLALREQLTSNNNNIRYTGSLQNGHVQISGAPQYGGTRAKYLLPPAIQPIVVNDLVIFRTSKAVVAVDAITGKLAWDKELPMIRERTGSSAYYGGMVVEASDDGQYCLTAGQDMVFTICEASPQDPSRRVMFGRSPDTDNSDTSCLAAISISSEGRLVWKIGNGKGSDELIRGGRFIGAPVYKDGRLYVAMCFAEAYHMVCLDAADGRLIWKCMISQCPVQSAMYGMPQRPDLAAVAVADDKAFMLTNAAVIAAVDADNGQPIWAYQYEVGSMGTRGYYRPPTQQSFDPSNPILVVGRRLICLPSDHKNVLCLDTTTGRPLWSGVSRRQQKDLSYVDEGRVLLSGKGFVLLDIKDGSELFSKTDLEVFGRPAVNTQEVLASGNGELLRLDLAKLVLTSYPLTPRNVDRSSTDYLPEDGLLGHLICVDGKLIAANAAGICAYFGYDYAYQEVTRRLESAEPTEKLARTLQRAKLSLNAHKYAKALDDLKACNAMISAGADAGLKMQVQTNLFRTYVALGNTAEQPAKMLENYELAAGFTVSNQDKAHSLLRLAKARLANKDFKTALAMAQELADKYGEENISDVKIGPEGEQADREKSKVKPGRAISQELVAQIVSKPEGRVAYETFDKLAQQEYDKGKAQKDSQVLASVAERWPNSIIADKARLAAAEQCYFSAQKAPKTQADEMIARATSMLIDLRTSLDKKKSKDPAQKADPLAASATVGLAMVYALTNQIRAKLTLDMLADQDMQQQVEFADYHGSLAGAIKQIESGTVLAIGPAADNCSLSMPLDKVYSTAGIENLGYGCHLVTDQDLNPVRLGEQVLVQSDDGWLMLLDSQAGDDKKAGGWTAITPVKPPKNVNAGMRPVAGLSKDSKSMMLCDRGTVCLIDVSSAKLKWDKKPDELGLPSIAFASAGQGYMVLVSSNGKVVCVDIAKGEVAWDSEPGGTPRAPAIITNDLAVLQYGRAVMCWNLANGKLAAVMEGKEYTSATVTPKGLLVALVDGEMSLRDGQHPDKILWTVPKTGGGQGFLLDASDKRIVWCPQSGNEIQTVEVTTGQVSQNLQLTRKGGGTASFAISGQIDGDQVFIQCGRNNVNIRGMGYRPQVGAAELVAVDLAKNEVQWSSAPDADNPNGYAVLPLRVTSKHVVLTVSPLPIYYGGSVPNTSADVQVLDRRSGQVLEDIDYDASSKKKDQPAAVRGMISPPAVTSNRLMAESAEGVTVYGGK